MARSVSVSELMTHCLRIVEEVATRRRKVVVTKRGKRVAPIVPLDEADSDDARLRLRGTLLEGEELSAFDTGVAWRAVRR
jgi:prevent-host-death family protein